MKEGLAAWAIIGMLLLVSFGIDGANTAQGGAIDLRNRITGLRLLEHGIDAYHYKWTDGDPEDYCDVYNNPKLPVSKTTATPALLLLHWPVATLPYPAGRFVWLALQWALLLGIGALFLWLSASARQRLLVAAAITAFTYTAAWRLHAERGQTYVLLAFLFAVWLVLSLDQKKFAGQWEFVAGCVAGFLITLRPTFALTVPFLALHRRKQLVGVIIGAALGFGLPLLVHPASWNEYYTAMQTHSSLYRNDIDPRPGPRRFPPTVEGMPTDTLGNYVTIPYADFSVFAFLRPPARDAMPLGSNGQVTFADTALPAWPVEAALVILFGLWLWFSRKQLTTRLFIGMAAWLFLADMFLPAYRDSYNDVLFLDVIALAFATAKSFPRAAWPFVLAIPAGLAIYICAPENDALINVPTAFLTACTVAFLALPFFSTDRTDTTNKTHRTTA